MVKKIEKILLKKATGYTDSEITAEYIVDESGGRRLVKEKVQTKVHPPDVSALKTYMEYNKSEFDETKDMTDEQLKIELKNLMSIGQKLLV